MLAERMNDGLSHVDENGILVYVNRRCAEMLGYTQDEMIGNHWSSFYADDSRAIVAEQLILRRKGISERIQERTGGSFISIYRRSLYSTKTVNSKVVLQL